jgi:hypothetical protein
LELTASAAYGEWRIEQLFTSPRWRPRPGDRFRTGSFEATVITTNEEHRPTTVRFVFDEPLESD